MIFLFIASVFDGDGDEDECIITTTRAFARALQDGFTADAIIWDSTPTDAQNEAIENGVLAITTALNE